MFRLFQTGCPIFCKHRQPFGCTANPEYKAQCPKTRRKAKENMKSEFKSDNKLTQKLKLFMRGEKHE